MKLLSLNGIAYDTVYDALSGNRTIDFRYERLNDLGVVLGEFPGVMSCSVDHSAFSEIKRTVALQVKETAGVDYLNDRLKVFMRVLVGSTWLEWPLGVFILSSPTRRSHSEGLRFRQVDGYDQTLKMSASRISNRTQYPAGTNVVEAAKEVAFDAGVLLINAVALAKTLPAAKEWEPGTTRLQMVNDLLDDVNYNSVWFDSDGYARMTPYRSPSNTTPEVRYLDDSRSILFPQIEATLDTFDVANEWVLIVSEPDRPALVSKYTNTNPASPTSTVSRGFTVTDFRKSDTSVDQATLDASVLRLAEEASQIYERVNLETRLMPHHEHLDVIEVRSGNLDVSAVYQEVSWSMECTPGGRMKHILRKLVAI